MDIIKTGIGLSKTIKNVTRLREIVAVFAKNGFDEFIIKTGLHSKIPDFVLPKNTIEQAEVDLLEKKGTDDWWSIIGFRLRKSFEELGPTFIKLGQLLSTREDIFDVAFIDEMKKLRDKVKGVPFAEIKAVIEKSLEGKCEDLFTSIEENPIGTASIGVVYKAVLKNNEQVVVKVRRPNIVKSIETDFAIMIFIAGQLEKVSTELKYLGLSKLLNDFEITLKSELDFRIEAMNCSRMKENLAKLDHDEIFYLPKVYQDLTSEEVLVMEFLDGVPFTHTQKISQVKEVIAERLEKGLRVFIHTLLADGFFHADLHGGNFFLLKDNKIGIIDFGLIGSLSRRNRINLVAILYALITHNYDNLIYEFLDVAEYEQVPEIDQLIRDVRDALSPYVGLTVQQINMTHLFRAIFRVLSKHHLYLPREWFVVFRALLTLDGVGRSLEMDFDIFGIIDQDIRNIIKSFVTVENALEEAVWAARDTFSSLRAMPRHIRWFLKELAKKQYAIEIINTGYNQELKALAKSLVFGGHALFAAALAISGSLIVGQENAANLTSIPHLTWGLWGGSFMAFIRGLYLLKRK